MKSCSKCGHKKSSSEFHARHKTPSQLQSWCKECVLRLNREKYAKNPKPQIEAHSKYYLNHREQSDKKNRKWAEEHPEARKKMQKKAREKACPDKTRNTTLLREYGITLEQFDEMMLNQGGFCAICNCESKLTVDHNHKTKAVRGLLCGSCNRALGLLKDSPSSARSAAAYLERAH